MERAEEEVVVVFGTNAAGAKAVAEATKREATTAENFIVGFWIVFVIF